MPPKKAAAGSKKAAKPAAKKKAAPKESADDLRKMGYSENKIKEKFGEAYLPPGASSSPLPAKPSNPEPELPELPLGPVTITYSRYTDQFELKPGAQL